MTNSKNDLKAQLQVLMSLVPDNKANNPAKLKQYLTSALETDKIASTIKRLLAEYNAYMNIDTLNKEAKELNKNLKGLNLETIPKDTPDKVYKIQNKNKEAIKKHQEDNNKKREKLIETKKKLDVSLKQASINELKQAIKTLEAVKDDNNIKPIIEKYKATLKNKKKEKKKKKKESEEIAAAAKKEEDRAA